MKNTRMLAHIPSKEESLKHLSKMKKQWHKHTRVLKQKTRETYAFVIRTKHIWRKPQNIAIAIVSLAALWLMSGDTNRTLERPSEQKTIPSVVVTPSQATPHQPTIVLRGQTEAFRFVDIRAQSDGFVETIAREKGTNVTKDTILLTFDNENLEEKKREAEALMEEASIQYDASQQLISKGHRSQINAAQMKTRFHTAAANLSQIEHDITKKIVKAPFDGILLRRDAEIGSYLRKGDVVATLIDLDPLLITAEVSEQLHQNIKLDMPITAQLVNGETFLGRITYVAAAANPRTRTFRIEAQIPNDNNQIPSGISAEIIIKTQAEQAHLITPSILNINDDGIVGIKTVTKNNTIAFYPVTIIEENPQGLWITGPPEYAHIVTTGQDFVINGQIVRPFQKKDPDDKRPLAKK